MTHRKLPPGQRLTPGIHKPPVPYTPTAGGFWI